MHDAGCYILVGEFQFGPEISFERFRELEDILKDAVKDLMGELGATQLEFGSCGDYLRFQTQAPDLPPDTLFRVGASLIPFLDPGVKGRVVCIPGGFGDVATASFSRQGVKLATTPTP